VYFKIFWQNQIQKFKVTRPRKFIEVQNGVKITKKNRSIFSKIVQFPVPLSTTAQNITSLAPNLQAMWPPFTIFDGI
jgi:hypothetical protein